MIRRLLIALAVAAVAVVSGTTAAWGHNSLTGSTPVDGATVQSPPSQAVFVFGAAVPLDTFSAVLIDASGARTDLGDVAHGSSGDSEVVVALPAVTPGSLSIRWRLVGPDGHVITGRVGFTVATQPVSVSEEPGPSASPTTTSAPPVALGDTTVGGGDGTWTTPDAARWALRFGSYLAIMTILGVLGVGAFVWARAATHPVTDSIVRGALAAAFVAGLAQLLVIASDISGTSPLSSLAFVDNAMSTDAGKAYAIRLLALTGLAICLYAVPWADAATMQAACLALVVVLLATWAYAGHSKSMRAALIGVPVDVAHHGAAALWLGGLIVVGGVVMRHAPPQEAAEAVRRFAALAAPAVAVVAVTGVIQSVRLVGNPVDILDARHGRYLLAKLSILGVMLWLADKNRRAVARRFSGHRPITTGSVLAMRRAIGTEFAVGMVIIAVTAVMVVSPPSTAVATESPVTPPAATPADSTVTIPATLATTTTAPAIPAISQCFLTGQVLSEGSIGPDVTCLETVLYSKGYLTTAVDERFEADTTAAVVSAQVAASLEPDGLVGPNTATALGIWPAGP